MARVCLLRVDLNAFLRLTHGEHGEALAYKWAAKNRFHRGGAEYAEKSGERPGDSDSGACAMDVVVFTDVERGVWLPCLGAAALLRALHVAGAGSTPGQAPGGKQRWRATALHGEAYRHGGSLLTAGSI